MGSTNRQEFLHDLAETSLSPRWEIWNCELKNKDIGAIVSLARYSAIGEVGAVAGTVGRSARTVGSVRFLIRLALSSFFMSQVFM